jgi:hypothetical protein
VNHDIVGGTDNHDWHKKEPEEVFAMLLEGDLTIRIKRRTFLFRHSSLSKVNTVEGEGKLSPFAAFS